MRLLFDENLSPRLCETLADLFAGAIHVREAGLQSADDAQVWSYASQHDFAIVTKDADFRQRSFLLGHPPKVIWVRLGNCFHGGYRRCVAQAGSRRRRVSC